MHTKLRKRGGFTLAEVLITLGVIGVVAAVTMPMLVTSVQERVRKEQVRTVKYKLTKATDKMNSLGKIKQYNTTMDFVNELKKHMSIAKICDNDELEKCWPSSEINAYSGSGTTLTAYNPKDLTTGQSLKALALSTKSTQTVGIVTGDGVPMLMVYSPSAHCNDFDETKTYTWSVEDGKPVTNATTNCISAIFDINGSKGPNKIGQDVRTLNSLFGSTDLGVPEGVGIDICNKMKQKHGFQYCNGEYTTANNDRWVGGIYECDKLGLHLPSIQTLAVFAISRYGDVTIGPYTALFDDSFGDCREWIKNNWADGTTNHYYFSEADIRCNAKTNISDDEKAYDIQDGRIWANQEASHKAAYNRTFTANSSQWLRGTPRNTNGINALCVGD